MRKFLSNIIRLIEDHLSESELNVNALFVNYPVSVISRFTGKLNGLTGMSPVEYIKSIRMKKAAMLLQQKKFTVAEVMYMVGFFQSFLFLQMFSGRIRKNATSVP